MVPRVNVILVAVLIVTSVASIATTVSATERVKLDGTQTVSAAPTGSDYVNVGASDLQGNGTASDPYVITNASELQAMEDNLSAYYELGADIDASETIDWNGGKGFDPIGHLPGTESTPSAFVGTLAGNGHTISGLTINRPTESRVGLIGFLEDEGTVKNISVITANITADLYAGVIVGTSDGTVISASATGTVTGSNNVGGIAGSNDGSLTGSSANVTVVGGANVGGLVGMNDPDSTVRESSATGSVNASSRVGGLVGINRDNASVRNSYATGTVTGNSNVGGLVGWNREGIVRSSYATGPVTGTNDVGGLIGLMNNATTRESYWDKRSTGQSTSAGDATALTTAEMTGQSARTNMVGFDFDSVWQTRTGDYPTLTERSDSRSGPTDSDDIVVATNGSGDYTSIQTAVNNADQSDRIRVRPGTYSESVDVNKDVTIVAPDGATIAPPSGAVSAVAITGASEPHLENLTITGDNRIGLDARSTTGEWTVTDLQITGVDFGIAAGKSTGEWVVSESTIENIDFRGVAPEKSKGNWTINSSTIHNISGIGIDAYRIEAGLIKNTKIINITQNGIHLDDTSGDWVVENATVENVGAIGINAGDTNATHAPVIRDATVVGTSEEGIDIAGSKSNVLITGSTVRNTGDNAIRIEESVGDWTIEDTTIENISGEGIDAYNQPESSHATIRNLTVTDTQNHGVNFYNSSGDWDLIDSQISNSERKGVEAGDTTGNWSITSTTVKTTNSTLIEASGAAGNWEIHESKLLTSGVALDATKAAKGNASYNYWGATDGPSGQFNGTGGEARKNVIVTPYYIDSSLTTLGNSPEGNPLDPPVGQYDTDADGKITIVELGSAASDYASGKIGITELGAVASVYASS